MLFDILYHIFICPLICLGFHFIFHAKYDKKHIHVDYKELAKHVKDILDNQEEEKLHFCNEKCGTKGSRK